MSINKDSQKAPILRFKGFTDDWEQRKLGDLGEVSMNKRIYKDQTTIEGDVPFVKIGTFGKKPDSFISRELFEEYKLKYPYPNIGDILISAAGSIGRTLEYNGEDVYFQDSNIVWLNHKGRLDNNFLKYFYMIVKWSGLEGSTIKRLYNKNILSTQINLPNIIEQEKIGTFLNCIENTIRLHQRKLDQLNQLKEALLQQMFPGKGETVPKLRFAGFEGDWEERKLSSMTMYKNGKSHEEKQSTSGKYELINLNSISISGGLKHSGKFIEDTNDTLQKDDLVMILSDVGHGDLLGRVALIPNDNKFVLNQRVALLRPNETADPHFLFSYINAHQHYFKSQGAGMSQLNISKGSVENFTSNVPTIQEQNHIGIFFKSLDNIIVLYQGKLEQLQNMKQVLLQNMFI